MKLTKALLLAFLIIASTVIPAKHSLAQEAFIGEIKWFGTNFCPRSFIAAEGQLLSINQNQALFSLYGITFGGDGRTTFAIPDLLRIPVKMNTCAG